MATDHHVFVLFWKIRGCATGSLPPSLDRGRTMSRPLTHFSGDINSGAAQGKYHKVDKVAFISPRVGKFAEQISP
jgi:hypothetical protein